MGRYLNPGNEGFREILRSDYVDKTGMIDIVNNTINTKRKLTCISRPRRFGKSFSAQMFIAYYDRTCDSKELFSGYAISACDSYSEHINGYNVISFDVTGFISDVKSRKGSISDVPKLIMDGIRNDIITEYSELSDVSDFTTCLMEYVRLTGRKIIFIIDEWDSIIREVKNDIEVQEIYLNFLRGLFKNNDFTPQAVAAAYITGILPIKKDGSQSAISDFNEFSVVKPRMYGQYVGFTEEEVKSLCNEYGADFDKMKWWYDGYTFKDVGSVYNPNSVMKALQYNDYDSYWTQTSAAEGLMEYISKDYNGLSKTIAELIGGVEVKVDTNGFANDLVTFKGKDDVLTLLIHLGYLAYNSETGMVHIPNEEIRKEFAKSIREVKHSDTIKRIEESDKLFEDTLNCNEEAVAAQIEKIHSEETTPLHYNKEDSLRSVIKLAYYTYKDNYIQWEELPSGDGYADIVYFPKHDSNHPVLIIELKWNKSTEGAIDQILKKNYPQSIKGCGSDILLVGINYDKDAPAGKRKHECKIIKVDNM